MDALKTAPWTITLPALIGNAAPRVYWRVVLTSDGRTATPPVLEITVEQDARYTPRDRVTLTVPEADISTWLKPYEIITWRRLRVDVYADYQPNPGDACRIMSGVAVEVSPTGTGQVKIVAVSFEELHEERFTFDGRAPTEPQPGQHITDVLFGYYEPGMKCPELKVVNDPDLPLAVGTAPAELENCPLGLDCPALDWVRLMLDCYPDAGQLVPTADPYTFEVYTRTVVPSRALDLRPNTGLRLDSGGVRYSLDAWYSDLDLIFVWTENGTQKTAETGTTSATSDPLDPTRRARVTRRQRPTNPADMSVYLPLVHNLAARAQARVWAASGTAKPALWLRPGMSARVTDDLTGLVAAVRFTTDGTTTYTVEPI